MAEGVDAGCRNARGYLNNIHGKDNHAGFDSLPHHLAEVVVLVTADEGKTD